MENKLKKTILILNVHAVLIVLLDIVIVIGASIAAIQEGENPVTGILAALFIGVMIMLFDFWPNRYAVKGLKNGKRLAWTLAFLLCLRFAFIGVGILGLVELLKSDVRNHFWHPHLNTTTDVSGDNVEPDGQPAATAATRKPTKADKIGLLVVSLITAAVAVFPLYMASKALRAYHKGFVQVENPGRLSDEATVPNGSYVSFTGSLDPDRVLYLETILGEGVDGYFIALKNTDTVLVYCTQIDASCKEHVKPYLPNPGSLPSLEHIEPLAQEREYRGQILNQQNYALESAGPDYLLDEAAEAFDLESDFRIIDLDKTPSLSLFEIIPGFTCGGIFALLAIVAFVQTIRMFLGIPIRVRRGRNNRNLKE
jgi:hypothetical protein